MADLGSIQKWIAFVSRERQNDVQDYVNLDSRFMAGRKVGKVPSASTDVSADDRAGDFNYSASFFYLCVPTSSTTVAWRRIALATW